jgi:hypothetical protein
MDRYTIPIALCNIEVVMGFSIRYEVVDEDIGHIYRWRQFCLASKFVQAVRQARVMLDMGVIVSAHINGG